MVRLSDRPDITLDVYRGRKTTMQQQQHYILQRVQILLCLYGPSGRYFDECSIINLTFIGFAEASRYWSVQFFLLFIGHTQSAGLSFVKTTESYKVSLVNIKRQTSLWLRYSSSRLRNHMRFVDWVTIWIIHILERTKTGLIAASDQTVRAVHSCNSLFVATFHTVRSRPGKMQTYFIHK